MPDGPAPESRVPPGFARHDLVRADPDAWAVWLDGRADLVGVPHLRGWALARRPLIVRRRGPREAGGSGVALGLPLPPADGKRRIGLALPRAALTPTAAPDLSEAVPHAPTAWRPTLAALAALGARHGVAPRPFGGLLWQVVTGLAYLTASSDLDLLWPCPGPVPSALLDGIATVARDAPMRLDGEILLPDGAGIHWSELRDAPKGGTVLAKRADGLAMRPADPLRAGRSASSREAV